MPGERRTPPGRPAPGKPPAEPSGVPVPGPGPGPAPGSVHVWRIPLSGPEADTASSRAARVLSADETARAARLVLPEDRRRWTAARVALRTLLSRCTGVDPGRITLEYGRHGKPRLPGQGADGLCFSLSHSRDRALLAMCRGAPVGADLEHLSAGPAAEPDLDDLASAVLAPEEWHAYLRLAPARRRGALLSRWTGKEAALKATGRGVTLPALRRLAVPGGSGPLRGLPGEWTLLRPWPGDGFTAAVTVRGRNWNLVSTDFSYDVHEADDRDADDRDAHGGDAHGGDRAARRPARAALPRPGRTAARDG